MATAKKYPEFELPTHLIDAIKGYLGPARMSKLSASQRARIAEIVQSTSAAIGEAIEAGIGEAD